MNKCSECGRFTANPRFCGRSCSVRFNNRLSPKRRRAEVGIGPQEKTCSRCKAVKPFSAFTIEKARYPSSRCKPCTNEMMKARKVDRELVAQRRRLQLYGLTEAERQQMLKSQAGLCALCCKRHPTCVDHDHQTGRVRGLLCSSCNRSLGILGDTPAALSRALAYVSG